MLFVGIDAADPDYLERRFAEGALPHLASFRQNGAWGRMRSTFPVLSSAAWSSISTGLPPEKHGIYEFFRRIPGTWQDEPVHGGMKKGEDLWQIASRYDRRCVAINMPITYPPRKVSNCIIVSGMDTPGESVKFVSPEEEKSPLLEAVPDYRIELTAAQFKTIEDFLTATSKAMEARKKAALYLFDRWRPDLALVIFTALDRVLHALWKYVDPGHPAFHHPDAAKWRDRVDRLYDEVDHHLGELMQWAGEDAITLVCSDHGGAAVHGTFYLNRWLIQNGYLKVRGSGSAGMLRAAGRIQKTIKVLVPRQVKNMFNRIFPNLYPSVETKLGLARVDPSGTRVYGWRKTDVLRLNLAGREPGGKVVPGEDFKTLLNEVKEKLEAVIDPRNGRQPISKVWTRHEIYRLAGELDDCPDLMIEWGDLLYDTDTSLDHPTGPLFVSEERPGKPWREEINGNHALHGIFGMMGTGIQQGSDLGTVDILSIAPAAVKAMKLPPQEAMPGPVPENLFKNVEEDPGSDKDTTAAASTESSGEDADSVYSDEERALIEKRLRDLGYM